MSSGSYFPPPVKAVAVPKLHGDGVRMLGVPTVADRVAQTVVAMELEKVVEPKFHPSSYGYRPGRSALDAVEACRARCFTHSWVLDCDIAGFFDNVPHDLIVKAVEANTDLKWVVLYVQRWLTAPIQRADGTLARRDRGTPQGSAISPLLANLFLHYALDRWMARRGRTPAASGQDQGGVLPARRTGRSLRDHLVHVPGLYLPQAHGPGSGRSPQRLPPGCPQRRDEEDESRRARLAVTSVDHPGTGPTRGLGQPDRARVAQLLRPVLPDRVAAPHPPDQRLHPEVGSQEVQTARIVQTSQGVVDSGHETCTRSVRALAVDGRVLIAG